MSIQKRDPSEPLNGQRSSLFIPKAIEDEIRAMICHLPGRQHFILDRDLASLCGLSTGKINECAGQNENYFLNKNYFPEDLRFQLTWDECNRLLSEMPRFLLSCRNKKTAFDTGPSFIFKDLPWAYTIYGVKTLAEVLDTPLAKERMKMIVHIFIKHEFVDKDPLELLLTPEYKDCPLTPKELEGRIRSMICHLPNRPPFILDCDLADIYGVDIRRINRLASRNKELFPDECRFQLGRKECSFLLDIYPRFSLSKEGGCDGYSQPVFKKLPWAYTIYGVKALGSVLETPVAGERIEHIIRAFEYIDLAGQDHDKEDYEKNSNDEQDSYAIEKNFRNFIALPKGDNGDGKIYTQEDFAPFLFENLYLDESIQINETPYFTRMAIGILLKYENPKISIDNIISRNPYIQQFATTIKLGVVEGARQVCREREVYDPIGLQLIINKSNQPAALKFQVAAAHLVWAYYSGRIIPKPKEEPIPETAQKPAPEPAPKPFSFSEISEEFIDRAERLVALAEKASHDSNINTILKTWGIISKPAPVMETAISFSKPLKKTIREEETSFKMKHFVPFLDCYEVGIKLGITGQKVLYWDKCGRFDGYKQKRPPFRISPGELKKWARTERKGELAMLKHEITTTEAAQFLAVSADFIQSAIRNKLIEARKNDIGHYLINTESLINLM